jgi:hypothetical protein
MLSAVGMAELHEGDCIYGDEMIAAMARFYGAAIIGHPPDNDKARAHFPADYEWEPQPYLVRDRAIVDQVEILLAAPPSRTWRPHDGAWYTVNYAKKLGVPIMFAWPEGDLEGWPSAGLDALSQHN